jgi:stage II sporulation protein R
MKEYKLKTWELAALCALCVSLCVGTWAQGRQRDISSSLVRLHVIAASDETAEQELKLRVRDNVLEYLTPVLDKAESPEEAQRIINGELTSIKAAAEACAGGRSVSVTLGQEYYPTREYEGFTLPAGQYQSLRVILGEGKGHNWWCVVFPPLCVSAAEQNKALDAMSEPERGLITEADGYELRFRIVELWGELMELLNK